MTELYLLGPAEIRNSKGDLEHSFLAGPKRLALLAYLLLKKPRGFHRRDSLLALFWPDQNQRSARNALSNMLYHIRKTLGKDAVGNRGMEEIIINPDALWCDALAFEKFDSEQDGPGALGLYRSELLKGFFVSDISSEFDHWLEQERNRFHSLAVSRSWKLAEKALASNNNDQAKHWAMKTAGLDPYSEEGHLKLIRFLDLCGDQPAALEVYRSYSDRLLKEFEEEPEAELRRLIDQIKEKKPAAWEPVKATHEIPMQSELSLAVLPFETLGQEKTSAFTNAIYGDILTRLSQIAELFVTSRTSARHFMNSEKLLPQIARELKVNWILTGEVQEIKNQVKVSVRLVYASEDRQVWAEIYQRKLTADELFNIQAEITQKITDALRMRLSIEEKTAIMKIPTEDLEAFRLNSYGRWNLDQRTEKAMRLSEKYFRKAISLDPNYAQAWLGLADSLILIHDYGYETRENAELSQAQQAVYKSLQLEPNLSDAFGSLGLLHTTTRNGRQAIKNLKKAVDLRHGNAEAHAWLAWIHVLIGNRQQGLESAKEAVKYNPLSQEALINLSLAWLSNGFFEESLREARRLLHIQPNFTSGRFLEGLSYYHMEMYAQAEEILKDLFVPWVGNGALVTRILCLIRLDQHKTAEKLTATVKDDPFSIALIDFARGNNRSAFEAFRKIDNWDYWGMLAMFHFFPDILDKFRKSESFKEVLYLIKRNWGLEKEDSEEEVHSQVNPSPVVEEPNDKSGLSF